VTPKEADVDVFNGMFPVQAGKEEAARAFAAETMGARRSEFAAHHLRAGNTRETWALQETPMGSFILVWFEGDVEKAFADLATNDSEFMVVVPRSGSRRDRRGPRRTTNRTASRDPRRLARLIAHAAPSGRRRAITAVRPAWVTHLTE
jgi:hypothetical protein